MGGYLDDLFFFQVFAITFFILCCHDGQIERSKYTRMCAEKTNTKLHFMHVLNAHAVLAALTRNQRHNEPILLNASLAYMSTAMVIDGPSIAHFISELFDSGHHFTYGCAGRVPVRNLTRPDHNHDLHPHHVSCTDDGFVGGHVLG